MDEQTTPTMQVFGLQTGVKMLEMICCFLTASCALLAVSFFFAACLQSGTHRGRMYAASLVAALMAFGCGKFGLATSRKARDFMAFDLVSAADLPVPDSLVRASSEPMQAQEAMLLRAAAQTQEGHEEQLLRAAGKQE